MTDVARAANCSQSTVSFVLNHNNSVQISDATRQRVREVAEQLGYEGAGFPSPLRVRPVSTGVIAFVIDNLSMSWEGGGTLIEGVRQGAGLFNTIVLAAETQNDPRLEPDTLSHLINQNVEAIVYACVHTRKVVCPPILAESGIPAYLLNCYSDTDLYPSVVPSEIAGGQRATQVLIEAGHLRIATITGETYMEAARERLTGYRRALATADIPFDPSLVLEGDWSASAGFYATQRLLDHPQPPTAIFCQNDRMAIGCYEALKENGLAIPRDMSVMGYDDDEISRHLFPPLTTMILPHRAMGRWVMEQHFDGAAARSGSHKVTKLECELVERNSIAGPRAVSDPVASGSNLTDHISMRSADRD